MQKQIPGVILIALILTLLLAGTVYAQTFLCTVDGGNMVCTLFDVEVLTPAATPVPVDTATPVPATLAPTGTFTPVLPTIAPSTATPAHDMASMYWHPPGKHGATTIHEHGDAPPAWVVAFNGGEPAYEHVAGTPNENNHDAAWWKHTSFKGWAGRFNNVNWYGIFHMDFNPSGHVSRFHSYQLWLQDATGAVSHLTGWLDFGEAGNEAPNLRLICNGAFSTRPVIAVREMPSRCPGGTSANLFESWYSRAGGALVDTGMNINSNYYPGGDPANPATWSPVGGVNNLTRRIEFAIYRTPGSPVGAFWMTQFREPVSGPNDPLCGVTVTTGAKTYTRVCLEQYIAPTLPTIQFPGNAVQRTFSGGNIVQLPN